MHRLEKMVHALEKEIPFYEWLQPEVSKGSVGWHIEHSFLTFSAIIEALKRSKPEDYKWKFNLSRTLVHTFGKMPRARAKAPASVQPKEQFDQESLTSHAARIREKLNVLETLRPQHFFRHPYFGDVNLKPARRFLEVHTKHHLAIIRDIKKMHG